MDGDRQFEEYMKKCWIGEYFDDNTPLEKCSNFRCSMICVHNESLKRMKNEETCFLLKKNLTKYSQMVEDDSTPDSVNNFVKPLKSIISGKIQTDHCTSWKFGLDACDVDPVSLFKESLSNTDSNCDLVSCKSSSLSEDTIKLIFTKKKDVEKCKFIQNIGNNVNPHSTNVSDTTKTNLHQSDLAYTNFNKNTNTNKTKNIIFNKNTSFDKANENRNPSNTSSVEEPKPRFNSFKTAREEYRLQQNKNGKSDDNQQQQQQSQKRSLGMTGSGKRKYTPPAMVNSFSQNSSEEHLNENGTDERLKHIDPKMVEMIISEILDSGASISWDDIAGLDFAKTAIQEVVVWPLLRPDIFTGLRRPPRGILLFGPPGTGKTLIAKCIASQCNATFFSISASSLMSKWLGEAEKMVRALFAVARCHQPAVVFIDEIDSLLTQRSDSEHETSRRVKTEFLVQLDGAAIGDEDRFLLIGATNRPQELDEAARRRLVKRLYIPLPDLAARKQIVCRLMNTERHSLTAEDINNVSEMADGFSGADMRSLCAEAALEPIRSIPFMQIANIQRDQVRPINVDDFKKALTRVRPSVSPNDLEPYIKWDATYGSGSNAL